MIDILFLANVHELYSHAKMETHGSYLLLLGIGLVVVLGAFIRIYFEGPSCPSGAKLTGMFPLMMHKLYFKISFLLKASVIYMLQFVNPIWSRFNAKMSLQLKNYLCQIFALPQILEIGLFSYVNKAKKSRLMNLKSYGGRSFALASAMLWNSLPQSLRNLKSAETFKRKLKEHLFFWAYMKH